MSVSAPEGQGQEPGQGAPQQGQEPAGTNGQQGQEPPAPDQATGLLAAITDPAVRATVERELTQARQEAAKYRTERAALSTKVQEYEQAQMTEAQRQEAERVKLQESNAALTERLREYEVGAAVAAAAPDAQDPQVIRALLASKVQTDDDGKPTNLGPLVAELRQAHPYLFRRGTADAQAGTNGNGRPVADDVNAQIRRAAGVQV